MSHRTPVVEKEWYSSLLMILLPHVPTGYPTQGGMHVVNIHSSVRRPSGVSNIIPVQHDVQGLVKAGDPMESIIQRDMTTPGYGCRNAPFYSFYRPALLGSRLPRILILGAPGPS